MRLCVKLWLMVFFTIFALSGSAVAACTALSGSKTDRVEAVLDGQTLQMQSGEVVRLVALMAPLRPLALADDADWPWEALARVHLESLSVRQEVRLAFGGRKRDRHNRLLAHVFVVRSGGEIWLQRQMLQQGLARAVSFSDNQACMGALYVDESAARQAKQGIWGDSAFDILPPIPARLASLAGTFQIIEGLVLNAAQVRDKTYLNFGTRWSRDFTVIIDESALKRFETVNISLLSYEKKRIRVRGWLFEDGGPVIEVNHPEQIEVVGEDLDDG